MKYLSVLAKLPKAKISFAMSVCPSEWKNPASTGQIFMKFDFRVFFEKLSEKIQVLLKSE